MGSDWVTLQLIDFLDIKTGFPFKSKYYEEDGNGYKLLRGDNIVQGAFRWANVKLWPKSELEDKQNKYFLEAGDVILAMDRPWIEAGLKTAQVKEADLPCLLVQRVACLKAKDIKDQKFLRYLISSYWFVEYVKLVQTGTAVPHISPKQILSYETKFPPSKEREKIGELLCTLDDKIELNRQMNETLESMAQALFKSWFVDFDPVIDNALAAGNLIPDVFAERAEQRKELKNGKVSFQGSENNHQSLFPSEFEFTEEMGWIPKGWEVGSISDVATENPESWTKKNSPETVLYVDLANTKNGRINHAEFYKYSDAPSRARRVLNIDDTIIGLVRPGNRSFAYIQKGGLTGSTGFAVMRPIKQEYRSFLYLGLTQDDVIDYFAHIADGAAYPAIRPEVVTNLECVVPSNEILELFDSLINPNLNKIGENENQGNELVKHRDTLLPKLLSGELRIPDAEKLLENV